MASSDHIPPNPTSDTSQHSFSIDLDAVRELESTLQATAREIGSLLYQLKTRLDVLDNQWSGEASEAYRKAQLEWNTSMDRMSTLLQRAGDIAGNTVARRIETRARVARLWQ
jgi:WXG100 family type VII secretion target